MATSITLSVPDNKVPEFLNGFLRSNPVPLDNNGQPTMTQAQWITVVAKSLLYNEYQKGKRMLQQDATIFDNSVIS
jgi:hypothetical protein